jgi:asparagine synthase (glutamine-hydrolysing)
MSCLFGIIRFDCQAVAVASLAVMRDALAYWGNDAARLWHDGPAGLGQLVSFTTPESSLEDLPRADANTGQVFTAAGRLDHRDDLCDALGLSHTDRALLADGDLMERAWQKWGQESVCHLKGDWSFAVWDMRTRRLFIGQAAYGVTSLFYHAAPGAFYFATGIKALLALPGIPKRPDLLRIGQILGCWPSDNTQTGYEGIRRLPAAHSLTVQEGQVQTRRYWFPEEGSLLRLKSDEEYADGLLEVFTRAVRSRLRGPRAVGGTLSGGLDSGAVCAVAARELGSAGRRLATFTSVPLHRVEYERPGSFADESPYVRADCEHFGNADPNFINAEQVSPLAGIRHMLERADEPGHAASNVFWIVAILARARELGVGVLLNGQMGNGTISYTGQPAHAWRCLARGEWRALARELPRSSHEFWPALKRHWLVPVWRPMKTWLVIHRQPKQLNWERFSAIRPSFVQSTGLLERMQEGGFDPVTNQRGYLFTSRRQERIATLGLGGYSAGGYYWAAMVAGSRVEARDPTFDEAVIEYCLRVPDEVYCRRGRYRWLIRHAMRGLLPDVVRLNEKRGKQAEDLAHRIRATKGEWVDALMQLEKSALAREALDLPRMRRLLDSLDDGITSEKRDQCSMVLARGVMVGEFLRRFD